MQSVSLLATVKLHHKINTTACFSSKTKIQHKININMNKAAKPVCGKCVEGLKKYNI